MSVWAISEREIAQTTRSASRMGRVLGHGVSRLGLMPIVGVWLFGVVLKGRAGETPNGRDGREQ
jgi:hypothetical protein